MCTVLLFSKHTLKYTDPYTDLTQPYIYRIPLCIRTVYAPSKGPYTAYCMQWVNHDVPEYANLPRSYIDALLDKFICSGILMQWWKYSNRYAAFLYSSKWTWTKLLWIHCGYCFQQAHLGNSIPDGHGNKKSRHLSHFSCWMPLRCHF